jgi:hypothetical protein
MSGDLDNVILVNAVKNAATQHVYNELALKRSSGVEILKKQYDDVNTYSFRRYNHIYTLRRTQ